MLKIRTFSVTVITQKSHYCYFLDCLGVGRGRQAAAQHLHLMLRSV